jgi:glycosyltransferase involved in cell wall biosynthesis
MAASTRYRFLQYLPYLEAQGIDARVEALLDDVYLDRLFGRKSLPKIRILKAYVHRVQSLLRANKYDLIWVHSEIFPWIMGGLESFMIPANVPYVVDYDDAVYHRYDLHRSPIVRKLLGGKIDRVMSEASLVVAGNQYIASRARLAGAKRVEIIPTVVDINRYSQTPPEESEIFTIGWIGSPSSAYNLQVVRPALEEFCAVNPARIVTVGSGDVCLGDVPLEVRQWTEQTEIQDIQEFDVGIMPLIDGPFEQGKNGFKLIQYMACARPVIGSPIGVNKEIIADGINGVLATGTEEWVEALTVLKSDAKLRRRQGEAGRHIVEERYSTQIAAPKLAKLLMSVA